MITLETLRDGLQIVDIANKDSTARTLMGKLLLLVIMCVWQRLWADELVFASFTKCGVRQRPWADELVFASFTKCGVEVVLGG
jgi:hypothetical protein